jgi:hypothetical protein
MSTPAQAKVISLLARGGATSQRVTGLLKHPIDSNDLLQHRKLVEKITQVERDERCVQRAVLLTAGFAALTVVGLGYGLILQEGFAAGALSFVARLLCEIALGSLFSLVGVVSLWLVYRSKLNGLTRDCRRLVAQLLECREQSSFSNGPTEENNKMGTTSREAGSAAANDALNVAGQVGSMAVEIVARRSRNL